MEATKEEEDDEQIKVREKERRRTATVEGLSYAVSSEDESLLDADEVATSTQNVVSESKAANPKLDGIGPPSVKAISPGAQRVVHVVGHEEETKGLALALPIEPISQSCEEYHTKAGDRKSTRSSKFAAKNVAAAAAVVSPGAQRVINGNGGVEQNTTKGLVLAPPIDPEIQLGEENRTAKADMKPRKESNRSVDNVKARNGSNRSSKLSTKLSTRETEDEDLPSAQNEAGAETVIVSMIRQEGEVEEEVPVKAHLVEEKEIAEAQIVKNPRRGIYIAVIIGITILASILGTLLRPKKDEDPATLHASPVSPTYSPTYAPTKTVLESLRDLFLPISGDTLFNESSHQYQALEWLVHNDSASVYLNETIPEWVIIERYIMVLFYLTTSGPTDNSGLVESFQFLSNSSICDWNSGEDASRGVRCFSSESDKSGKVERLVFVGSENPLVGQLPSELAYLSSLQDLALHGHVGLIGTTIPPALGRLSELRRLMIRYCDLTGSIPESFGELKQLTSLQLQENYLSGTVPEGLTQLASLESINLRVNLLTGQIPDFQPRTNMRSVTLWDNFFTGTIPSSIFFLASLENLGLEDNQLNGTIAARDLVRLSDLKSLGLRGNNLSGSIPDEFPRHIESVHLDGNHWEGSIPTSIGNHLALYSLDLSENMLTGPLPSEIGMLFNLEYLFVGGNSLSGPIPSELGQLKYMYKFFIDDNLFTGSVPAELSTMGGGGYTIVLLNQNNITGDLDPAFCDLESGVFDVTADCKGPNPELNCTCCTECCLDNSETCDMNVLELCHLHAGIDSGLDKNTDSPLFGCGLNCHCVEGGVSLDGSAAFATKTCTMNSTTCNEDGSVCFEMEPSVLYPSTYLENLGTGEAYYHYRYTEGRNDTVTISIFDGLSEDIISVNGNACDDVKLWSCSDGTKAPYIFCDNVEDAGYLNGCRPFDYESGALELFAIFLTFTDQGCGWIPDFESSH